MKTDKFRVAPGSKVNLKNHPTDFSGDYKEKKDAVRDLEKVASINAVLAFVHGQVLSRQSQSAIVNLENQQSTISIQQFQPHRLREDRERDENENHASASFTNAKHFGTSTFGSP